MASIRATATAEIRINKPPTEYNNRLILSIDESLL
jgi:hypothetical protein